MSKKKTILIEILIIVVAAVVYFFMEVWPDFKKMFGSSDKFINTESYKNMFEFNIDNNINFALVLNDEKKVYHIFFYNDNARCLYNKKIENNNVKDALSKTFEILIDNNYLKSTSNIIMTSYGEFYKTEFIKSLETNLKKYDINVNINYRDNTLENKAKELDVVGASYSKILENIDLYSKEITSIANSEEVENISITEKSSKRYANQVYKKIEKYVYDNNIKTLDINNTNLVITLIPADDDGKLFPNSNSWYYVENGKVYAYIGIGDKYDYCYKGSIDSISKGVCK